MKHSSSSSRTSLALAVAILAIVCCYMPCSAVKACEETIAKSINAVGYEVHEPQGGHVGWRPPQPWPKTSFGSSYPDYGSEGALVPSPAAALEDGQETQDGVNGGSGLAVGGDRKGRKPPSPWGRPGFGHR